MLVASGRGMVGRLEEMMVAKWRGSGRQIHRLRGREESIVAVVCMVSHACLVVYFFISCSQEDEFMFSCLQCLISKIVVVGLNLVC